MRTKFAPLDRPTLPSTSTALLTVGLVAEACDPTAHRLDRREMVDAVDDLGRRLAYASRPVSKVVQGLAMIAASIAVVCVTWWDPAPFAMAAIASLLGQRWVLGWLRRRHDGFHDTLQADDTHQRLSERVDDDRPAPQDRDDASFANVVSSCKFLPTSLPDGWTRPISTTDSEWWHVTVGREKLLLGREA